MPKKKTSGSKKYFLVLITILVVGVLGYGLYSYYTSGAKEQGIIVCNPQNPDECYWQAHIHTFVIQEVCGESKAFPKEHGELEEDHTHEETNIIHWHDRIMIEKQTGELVDISALTLGAYFDSVGVTLSDTCLYDKCNGDTCPDGSVGTVRMFVKHKDGGWEQSMKFDDYVWDYGDLIHISFDNKTSEEILEGLKESEIKFPIIGTG